MNNLDPDISASFHRDDVRARIARRGHAINVVGVLASEEAASRTYAEYTRKTCEEVGVRFRLLTAPKEGAAALIGDANADPAVHGIFVYFPVFGDARDAQLKDSVTPYKDVEGLAAYWMRKLYANERFDDPQRRHKCLLPCTALAILKLLEDTEAHSGMGLPFNGQTVTIFNRSDVVGKPLAYMLANDGAKVYSFDIDGGLSIGAGGGSTETVNRAEALGKSNVVVTGVPSRQFEKVRASEIRPGAVCINFSSVQNFDDDAKEKAGVYIPRVGPMTVAMCLRNALRLYEDHHSGAHHAA